MQKKDVRNKEWIMKKKNDRKGRNKNRKKKKRNQDWKRIGRIENQLEINK